MSLVVALTGPIASGKSSVARALANLGWFHASTSAYLRTLAGPQAGRSQLHKVGVDLDRDEPGWVGGLVFGDLCVVDALRTAESYYRLRSGSDRVLVVHLFTDPATTANRRRARGDDMTEYGQGEGEDLRGLAHLSLNTEVSDPAAIAAMVHTWATGRPASGRGYVDAVIGGQYGSEGKGHVVSNIAHRYDTLVRSGGPNAGHRVHLGRVGQVPLAGGKQTDLTYCYHHLPSGTLHNPNALVYIAAGATLYLPKFLSEVEETGCDARLSVDPNAVVITEADRNWEREHLVGAIGSTAQGVGRATTRRLMRGGEGEVVTAAHHPQLSRWVTGDVSGLISQDVRAGKRVMLEGTQGSGLSLFHGPYPKVTSRDTNVGGLLSECGVPPSLLRRVLLVFRTHPIRVAGNSGPMEAETTWEEVSKLAGVSADELRERERTSTTKRLRRVSEFDWGLFRASCRLNGPTDLALTFTDYHNPSNLMARDFSGLCERTCRLMREMTGYARAPVSLVSTGFGPGTVLRDGRW